MGKKQIGFTIVELAVVIVVIGILAAITIVSYLGVQNRTYDSNVQADLKNIAAAMKSYRANTGAYPKTESDIADMDEIEGVNPHLTRSAYDLTAPSAPDDTTVSRNLLICLRNGGAYPKFGIAALSKSGKVWFYTSDGGMTESDEDWVGHQTYTCPLMGITYNVDGYARWFGYERNHNTADVDAGWKGWTTK